MLQLRVRCLRTCKVLLENKKEKNSLRKLFFIYLSTWLHPAPLSDTRVLLSNLLRQLFFDKCIVVYPSQRRLYSCPNFKFQTIFCAEISKINFFHVEMEIFWCYNFSFNLCYSKMIKMTNPSGPIMSKFHLFCYQEL